jgi:hypothetical protein
MWVGIKHGGSCQGYIRVLRRGHSCPPGGHSRRPADTRVPGAIRRPVPRRRSGARRRRRLLLFIAQPLDPRQDLAIEPVGTSQPSREQRQLFGTIPPVEPRLLNRRSGARHGWLHDAEGLGVPATAPHASDECLAQRILCAAAAKRGRGSPSSRRRRGLPSRGRGGGRRVPGCRPERASAPGWSGTPARQAKEERARGGMSLELREPHAPVGLG